MTHLSSFHTILAENQFIVPSYEHYGGLAGFQDYGLLGTAIKNRLIAVWRQHFLSDRIMEVETPILMPYDILKASGHVDRFTDPVVYDRHQKMFRADHLIKDYLKNHPEVGEINVDNLSLDEMESLIQKYQLVDSDNPKLVTQNLMFATQDNQYLRPELAQGIFVNFQKYLSFFKTLPFGVAQIGRSFRKEVSPRPLFRMREFTQAEIEYFFNPIEPRDEQFEGLFENVKHLNIPLLSAINQLENRPVDIYKLGDAIFECVINHPILGYFLGKIYQFAMAIGLNPDKVRFREHLPTEKAHYSSGCWDLECLVEGDWIECVGCANRQSYDLEAHSQVKSLACYDQYIKIRAITKINRSVISKKFGQHQGQINQYLIGLLNQTNRKLVSDIIDELETTGYYVLKLTDINGQSYEIQLTSDCVQIGLEPIKYFPHVIEPSFGIDRLLYAMFEHNYWIRESSTNESRVVISLKPEIAPYDVAILQLSNKPELLSVVEQIRILLTKAGLKCYTDYSSTAIGKRYVRTDRYGIMYAITVDFDTLTEQTVTLRERDDMTQIRMPILSLLKFLKQD